MTTNIRITTISIERRIIAFLEVDAEGALLRLEFVID